MNLSKKNALTYNISAEIYFIVVLITDLLITDETPFIEQKFVFASKVWFIIL